MDRSLPAGYRDDLSGRDLVYELVMLMDKLRPGDTLRIHPGFLYRAGASLDNVLPTTYPHRRWIDDATGDLCVHRDQ